MLKLVVVVRADLNMPAGKLGVQVGHAVEGWLINAIATKAPLTIVQKMWLDDPLKRKILLSVADEAELRQVVERAEAAGVAAHVVTDAGLTVFSEPTVTVAALGPAETDTIDPVTRHLKLYR